MGLKRIREDSVAELRRLKEEAAAKEAKLQEQEETIELLKGCIMELADVVYGEETV